MINFKSTKLNKRQLIAAELLGVGYRPSEVAKKLVIRRETISRWQNNQEFKSAVSKAHLGILSNIVNEANVLTDLAHKSLFEVFEDEKISKLGKAGIGIRYLSLVGSQNNAYQKFNHIFDELNKNSDNTNEIAKWIVDILEGIKELEKIGLDKVDIALKEKIISLVKLSDETI